MSRLNPRWSAVFCAFLPALIVPIVRPYAETGINDDWSYISIAQALEHTGHIVYNGWASSILGWQLGLGALFARLFGEGFTTVRLSIVPVAMLTAFLLNRALVRSGLREWNAAWATIAIVLSPLFVPLTFSFMTDVAGLFAIVLCYYCCLRAVQAATPRTAAAWVSFAALSNAFFGNVRQIAWLGVLIIVPSALWLLRRRRVALVLGGLACAAGYLTVLATMHWYNAQPFSSSEPMFLTSVSPRVVINVGKSFVRLCADLSLLGLPVLLPFAFPPRGSVRRRVAVGCSGGLAAAVLIGLLLARHGKLEDWLAPFLGNYLSAGGWLDDGPIIGTVPRVIGLDVRLVLTLASFTGLISLIVVVLKRNDLPKASPEPSQVISWKELRVLLLPFAAVYMFLLIPRAAGGIWDRYELPLLFIGMIPVVRLYQERIRARIPLAGVVLIGIYAAYAVTATHDLFAMYRGFDQAYRELRSAGVAPVNIFGSWEMDGWTELETTGHVNDPRIQNAPGAYQEVDIPSSKTCHNGVGLSLTPSIRPEYGISFDPQLCDGPSRFRAVTYHTWLAPHTTSVYIVKIPPSLRAR